MIAVNELTVRAGGFCRRDVSFAVPAGHHTVIMGPSGTGKTTVLEALCGLRRIESGSILIAGRDITQLPPAERNIGFVPQDGALFPHLTVRRNVDFSLHVKKWPDEAIATRTAELAALLGLEPLLERSVTCLSGGERQRVALARALAARPPVLLLDEPLSALDAASREALRCSLQGIRREEGVTILHVTHDAADAAALATEVIQF